MSLTSLVRELYTTQYPEVIAMYMGPNNFVLDTKDGERTVSYNSRAPYPTTPTSWFLPSLKRGRFGGQIENIEFGEALRITKGITTTEILRDKTNDVYIFSEWMNIKIPDIPIFDNPDHESRKIFAAQTRGELIVLGITPDTGKLSLMIAKETFNEEAAKLGVEYHRRQSKKPDNYRDFI